ncbi:MAG: OmpH family outer membrane protein [Bacteroidales bacterium]|nr:OmpH family outer membrane protein [Bacteroidales bacterium]
MKKIALIIASALMALTAGAQNLGRVNFQELLYLMPEMDGVREKIDAAQKEASETYQSMVDEFQTKYGQYQQKQSSWTAAIKESKEKELADMQNRIQEFQQTVSQELQEQQSQLMAPLQEKVQGTIKDIAKAKKLTAVFDFAASYYFDEAAVLDITPDCRKALGIAPDKTLEALQQELAAKQKAAQN